MLGIVFAGEGHVPTVGVIRLEDAFVLDGTGDGTVLALKDL